MYFVFWNVPKIIWRYGQVFGRNMNNPSIGQVQWPWPISTSWGWRHWRGGMCRMPICVASQLVSWSSGHAERSERAWKSTWLVRYISYDSVYCFISYDSYILLYILDWYIYISLIGWILYYTVLYTMTLWYPLESYSAMIRYGSAMPCLTWLNPHLFPGCPFLYWSDGCLLVKFSLLIVVGGITLFMVDFNLISIAAIASINFMSVWSNSDSVAVSPWIQDSPHWTRPALCVREYGARTDDFSRDR